MFGVANVSCCASTRSCRQFCLERVLFNLRTGRGDEEVYLRHCSEPVNDARRDLDLPWRFARLHLEGEMGDITGVDVAERHGEHTGDNHVRLPHLFMVVPEPNFGTTDLRTRVDRIEPREIEKRLPTAGVRTRNQVPDGSPRVSVTRGNSDCFQDCLLERRGYEERHPKTD